MTDTPAPPRQTVLRIPAGATTSNHLPQAHERPTAITVPAHFTGTSLAFEFAAIAPWTREPGEWRPRRFPDGTVTALTVSGGCRISLSPNALSDAPFFRIAAAEPQAEETDFILHFGDEPEASVELPAEDPQPA
ncbi:MAG: hypothetical protein K2X11_02575 [Acetobacteraceae bacterium]|nr:hypothetical protein [Acetobacteraceae bacterium]